MYSKQPVTLICGMLSTFRIFIVGLLFFGCITTSRAPEPNLAPSGKDVQVHHYVFFGRDRNRITESDFFSTSRFAGAQLTYAWKELEITEGVYDFAEIQRDLDFLESKDKQMFVQLQDTTFNPRIAAVPQYLITDPKYHGGVVYQYDAAGDPEGLVALRWDPMVQMRFHKLLQALGQAFDGRIAGINLQETAIGVSVEGVNAPPNFSYAGYRNAVRENMTALKKAFSRSIAMQYVNYMPGEWLPNDDHSYMRSLFEHGRKIRVAIGAPDLMPKNPNQKNHAYKFMHELKSTMTFGVAVQDGNYNGTTGENIAPTKPWPNIVPQLCEFATSYLGVSYVFWSAQEPYFTNDVVPYFARGQ